MKATHSGNGRHVGNGKPNAHLGNGRQQKEVVKDLAAAYNQFKEFEGKKYTGMKIGRGHKWYYDSGEWKEKKITPDKWEFTYGVVKRRAGKAPEGTGVPVGTEYHWYILAHQNVRKLNANDYTTSMTGLKLKVAHKRADKDQWSASDRAQRNRLLKILREHVHELEQQQLQEGRGGGKKTADQTPARGHGRPSAGHKPRAGRNGGPARARKTTAKATKKQSAFA